MSESVLGAAACIAPFAVWMALLTALPATPWAYAVRTALAAGALAWSAWVFVRRRGRALPRPKLSDAAWALAVGLAVLFVWVWPEQFAWYRRWFILGEGGTVSIDSSAWYWKGIRLFGSAVVISAAEELFFRRWLVRFAGFGWMVALFAVEHDRWAVGALAGVAYGLLARRRGLWPAIGAHFVTNLALGLYVLRTGAWQFW